MMRRLVSLALRPGASFAAILLLFALPAHALVITGPTLDTVSNGHPNWGIQITAVQNVTLDSFVYHNLGEANTVLLTDVGKTTTFFSIAVAAGNPDQLLTPGWALTAGTSYWLLGEGSLQSNGLFANFVGLFPVANAELSVDSGVFSTSGNPLAWGGFNNLTTSVVPEPASAGLLALGLAGLALWRRPRG
jgi:hypothetical protein